MIRVLAFWTTLTASLLVLSGCVCEDYFCDETGCYSCDGLGCREVEPPTRPVCLGDYECAANAICTDAGCVAECSADEDCEEGTICRAGMCVGPTEPDPRPTPGSCTTNDDCMASGLLCLDGSCVPDPSVCEMDQDCGESESCVDGMCRPKEDVCQFNYECAEGLACVDGSCRAGCGLEIPCDDGFVCDEGYCIADDRRGCTSNAFCEGGQVCINERCIDQCSDSTPCADGFYCLSGRCRVDDRPTPFCPANACQPGHPCIGGICRTPCSSHDECLRFDVQFNFCGDGFCRTSNEVMSDCATSSDCTGADRCIDGICR